MLSHERSLALYAFALAAATALLLLTPRVGSRALSLGSGLAAGGAIATVVSGLLWTDGVPNPLVRDGIAFNVADAAIGFGVALLLAGALHHGWTHRDRLRETVV